MTKKRLTLFSIGDYVAPGKYAFSGAKAVSGSRLVNRNITSTSGRTSMRLEPEVWDALREICVREGIELRELIRRVEPTVNPGGRTSAIRVHVVQYFRKAATDEGHILAGHGLAKSPPPIELKSAVLAHV